MDCGIRAEQLTSHTSLQSFAEQVYQKASNYIVLSSIELCDAKGAELIHLVKKHLPSAACLLLAEKHELNTAEELLAKGADDYLVKDSFDANFLRKSIQFALERQRRRNVEQLAQRQLEAIYQHSSNAILLANDDMQYIGANPAACRMLDYTETELKLIKVSDVVESNDGTSTLENWTEFLGGKRNEGLVMLRKKSGDHLFASYKAVANILPGTHLSILQDVTSESFELRKNKILAEIYKITSEESDYHQSLKSILKTICNHLGYSGGELWRIGEQNANLFFNVGFYGDEPNNQSIRKERILGSKIPINGALLLEQVLCGNEPIEIRKTNNRPDFEKEQFPWNLKGKDCVAVPLKKEEKTLGCLFLFKETTSEHRAKTKVNFDLLKSITPVLANEEERMQVRNSLHHLINNAHDLIGIIDSNKKLLQANPAMEKALGYSKEELVGMDLKKLVAPEFHTEANHLLNLAIQDDGLHMRDILLISRFGEKKWIEFSTTQNMASANIYFIGRDVTAEKKSKDKLLKANRKFKLATKASKMGIWELDLLKEMVKFDKGVTAIYELDKTDIPMHNEQWKSFLHPKDQQMVLDEFARALASQESLDLHYRIITKNGTRKYVKISAEVLTNEKGETIGMVGLTLDVSDYVRSEKEKARAASDLKERVKEQTCLYNISQLDHKELGIDEMLSEAVKILPTGFQYSGMTLAAIEFNSEVFSSPAFTSTPWMLVSQDKRIGESTLKISIAYTEQKPVQDEGPFLKEERSLIEAVADNLATAIDRIISKQKLQERETRFRNLIEHNYDVILVVDENFKMKYVSPSSERLTGHISEEIIGSEAVIHVHPDDVDLRNKSIEKLLSGEEERVIFKERIKRKDGRYIWVHATVTDQRNVPGVKGFVFNLKDIDTEERFRRDLEQSQLRLQRAKEIAQVGYWRYDIENNDTYWSREVYDMYGIDYNTKVDFSMFIRSIHPEDQHYFKARDKYLESGQKLHEVEYRIIKPSGEIVWLRNMTHVESAEGGIPKVLEGTVQDIDSRKRSELHLADREQQLSLFMENSPALTWLKDAEGKLLSANEKFLKVTGRTAKDIGYKKPQNSEEVAPETWKNDQKVLKAGKAMRFTENIPDSNGDIRIYDVFKFPIKSGNQTFLGGFALDVTEKREYIKAIKLQNKKLREIAWTQSHVVRAPLARIMGLVGLFKAYREDGQPVGSEILDNIELSAEELDTIIRQMISNADSLKMNFK